jgi:2-polyprenyl-3-methyl-5-hydroxy-6-metoxy-1,4-benzoquinol methylase
MHTATFDTARSEQFSEKIVGYMNGAAMALMTSLGHRSGLFDSMKASGAGTAPEVATAAALDERYVREWLDAMVTGGIVEYNPATARYRLPDEHAAWLTRDAAPNNLAVMTQYTSVMGSVEDQILDCFRNGGGVPYSAYGRFHEVMAEDSGQTVLPALFDHILPVVPGIADRLEAGIDVLDIGCGRGKALMLMAARFPNSRFTGYDLSNEAIAWAREEASRLCLPNLRFEVRDLTNFSEPGAYDLVTAFDAIHDQAKPASVLGGVRETLREGGVFLMQDIAGSSHVHRNMDHPIGPLLYTISCLHCMTVSLAQGGDGLGAMWGEERAVKMLKEAGFGSVEVKRLEHDIQNAYYVCGQQVPQISEEVSNA